MNKISITIFSALLLCSCNQNTGYVNNTLTTDSVAVTKNKTMEEIIEYSRGGEYQQRVANNEETLKLIDKMSH